MDTKTMINQLKYEAEKHKNDSLFTGQTNITALCSDVIPKLEKLAEYETAEEEGRLVILPKCKIGDRVYLPIDFENKIYSGKVHGYMYFEPRKECVVKIRLDGTEIQYCHEKFEDFRNTFFLDYEEAEDKLKEMNKNE